VRGGPDADANDGNGDWQAQHRSPPQTPRCDTAAGAFGPSGGAATERRLTGRQPRA